MPRAPNVPNGYTPEQDTALFKGVIDYGLDFDRIRDENSTLLESRNNTSLEVRFGKLAPDKLRELKAAARSTKPQHYAERLWTPEQDAALLRRVDDYGLNFGRIRDVQQHPLVIQTNVSLFEPPVVENQIGMGGLQSPVQVGGENVNRI